MVKMPHTLVSPTHAEQEHDEPRKFWGITATFLAFDSI